MVRHSLKGDKGFPRPELEGHLGGLCAGGRASCNHEGFPFLVFQHFALVQNLHALLPNLPAAAVELVAVKYAQLQSNMPLSATDCAQVALLVHLGSLNAVFNLGPAAPRCVPLPTTPLKLLPLRPHSFIARHHQSRTLLLFFSLFLSKLAASKP